ncbi:MAG: GAF domain-containing sensor histidine kinase [Anaerolineaceae bacterium]|nr:GAF domain-containing sensor histidine kinase [Anaerolineaceae bacterium]
MDSLINAAVVGALGLIAGLLLGFLLFRRGASKAASRKNPSTVRRDPERAAALAERQRLREVYTLISTLTATLKYQRVLDMALDLSANALSTDSTPADRLVSAVLLFAQSESKQPSLSVGSARRFPPADMRVVLPGANGLIASVIESGEAQLCNDVAKDPELARFVALRACKVTYCLPLRAGLDTYGILLFAHPDPAFFTQANREILEIISHQAVIAIQNARLYSDLEQEKNRMMEIQEEARKKLARDLHDGPTQSVAAIAMRLNFVRRLMERDVKATADELVKIEDLARRTTKEIRHMLFTLRPLVLESQGLIAALEAMADKMQETYNQNVIIDADQGVIPQLEMGKQTVIFYIAEEAVNNARKHAQAAHIWVRLKSIDEDLVLLEIQDDGVGFNVSSVDATYETRGSLGMINMRERAELVNGLLRIESAEGHGTRIRVLTPITEEGADRLRRGL